MSNRDCNPQPDCRCRIGGDLEWGKTLRCIIYNLPDKKSKSNKVKPGQPDMAFIRRGERSEGRESKFGLQWKKISQSYASLRKERTGDTRLLNGLGGRIGITMRKITKADAVKDKKASARAKTRESMFLKFNRYLSKERKSLYMRKDV